jgi:hypothetical protein
MRRPLYLFASFVAVGIAAGCLDDSITGTRPVSFTLVAEPASAPVGDSITFTYTATGTSIYGVVINYGDGVIDTISAESPNQVERTESLRYAYASAGSFQVIGRVESAAGIRSDTVEVQVSAAP